MNNTVWAVIVLLIVIAGGWFLLKGTPAQAPTVTEQTPAVTNTATTTTTSTTTTVATPAGVSVVYTTSGFSPKSVTVPAGTTVTFVNKSGGDMWIASAPHPTHEGYDGTTKSQHCAAGYSGPKPFDQCSAGQSFTFTFAKTGTWTDHHNAALGDFGPIIVTAAPAVTPL